MDTDLEAHISKRDRVKRVCVIEGDLNHEMHLATAYMNTCVIRWNITDVYCCHTRKKKITISKFHVFT